MRSLFSQRVGRRCLQFLLILVLSTLLTSGLSTQRVIVTLTKTTAQPVAQALISESFLQEGIQFYESGQFADAINSWNQALEENAGGTSDILNQALLLSNLSLAHQHLGQWSQAEAAIAKSLSLLKSQTDEPIAVIYAETLAKAWNTQGRLHWGKGEMQLALTAWQKSTQAYRQAGHQPGILKSLLNQAKVLQIQGLYLQAKAILENDIAPTLQDEQLDPVLRATGWWHLGNAQRQFGDLSKSKASLEQSLKIIEAFQLDGIRGEVLLDAGNTEVALATRNSAIGKTAESKGHKETALWIYQQVAQSGAAMTQLQANLNRLSLLITSSQWLAAEKLWPIVLPQIGELPPSRKAIYTQLNFAKSLADILDAKTAQPADINADKAVETAITWQAIDQILVRAIDQAQTLADPIALSYGLGQRGRLYETLGQWSRSQDLTQRALQLTEENQFPDGRYRWEWQLGRLLKKQGQQEQAIQAYKTAVATLESVRDNLLFIDAEVQFSFRDNVEPVYRELVELLLSTSKMSLDDQTLDLAIKQLDNLQLSELENFLRCDLGTTTAISQFEADVDTAIIYPIILPDRLVVILQLQNKKVFTEFEVSQKTVEAILKQLRRDLSIAPSRTPEVRDAAKEVYKWLIQAIEPELQHYDIKTLVFVLDGPLRNIPMAVLHDGEKYLIEKYAIAVAPELELFTPRPLPPDLAVFTGGVGSLQLIEDRKFPPIQKLADELDKISELFGPQPPLTNENFQSDALKQQLSTGQFSGIHIKTHGMFSSDPEETFIVAYEELIRGQELGTLIQSASQQGETPVDLLVLSACSTATSDNRAILGLAGIAVRAGARSTVSTLWEAQDTPNTELMIRFYEELKQPDITRAQALRNAQLFLLNRGYRAPHIWATYVLVGNWR